MVNMPKAPRKGAFIVPFSQSDTNKVPQITDEEEVNQSGDIDWSTNWSPVHIGRHTQSITPATKRKIKHRFSHGLRAQLSSTRSSTRDISPGLCVPIEFSQSSYVSDIPDDETVVYDDTKEAAECVPPVVEEPPDKKSTPDDANTEFDQGFELEIEYSDTAENIPVLSDTEDMCNQTKDAYNTQASDLHENGEQLGEIKITEQFYDSIVLPCASSIGQNYHLDQTLSNTNMSIQHKNVKRTFEESNIIPKEVNGIDADNATEDKLDKPRKSSSVDTSGNCQSKSVFLKQKDVKKKGKESLKISNIKLLNKNGCLQSLQEKAQVKGASRTKVTNKPNKRTTQTEDKTNKPSLCPINKDNMTNKRATQTKDQIHKPYMCPINKAKMKNKINKPNKRAIQSGGKTNKPNKGTKFTNDKTKKPRKPTKFIDDCFLMINKPQLNGSQVKQRIKQHTADGMRSQDMLRNALKTTSKRSRRKSTITTCETIRQDVLKVMYKLHEEILELQQRRKQLMIANGVGDDNNNNKSSPSNTDHDIPADKVRLEGITEE